MYNLNPSAMGILLVWVVIACTLAITELRTKKPYCLCPNCGHANGVEEDNCHKCGEEL